MNHPLPFTAPHLLAPMEGVTEPCFRDLLLRRNPPAHLGGAFTEFLRVSHHPVSSAHLRRHLGPHRFPQPVGLQLMGADADAMAESARRAEVAGAPLVDVNFGCPAKGALRGCAGSALLDDPAGVEQLVAAVVSGVERIPVTAKIRAGGEDDSLLEDLARAAAAGGARLLTVHCRTRAEGYRDTADWNRLARAAAAVTIPVCGNGGVGEHGDLDRLRRETGCAFAMVGRAALGDPWIFTGRQVTPAEAATFLLEYAAELRTRRHTSPAGAVGRIKQLLQHWTAGDLFAGPTGHAKRRTWLATAAPADMLHRLEELAADA